MRKEMMILGLAGLLSGCDAWGAKYDVSRVGESIELAKPKECEMVKDIRYESGHGFQYQLLCSDKEGNLTLYKRNTTSEHWDKIKIK